MTPGQQLRRAIEACELRHPKFQALASHLGRRIEDAKAGFDPRIEYVIGPSRVGKTALIKHFRRLHSETKVDGRRHVPVLFASVMPGTSWLMLPHGVIKALGVPQPRASTKSGTVTSYLRDQLRQAGTRSILFEEASHLVDQGSRVPPRAAGDWFKDLSDESNVTLIMFGVPRLERLFRSNEQLEGRASAPLQFRPYDSRVDSEYEAFAVCVDAYAKIFDKHGFRIDFPLPDLVGECYLLSGGRVGILSKFMNELACGLAYESPRAVSVEDCQAAVAIIGSGGHPDWPPFQGNAESPIALAAAHAYVLETNDMSVQLLGRSGEVK